MKVLVTGATGFLGKYLIEELQRQGQEVLAFGRNKKIGEALPVPFIQGDLTDEKAVDQAVSRVDAVIHAGALSTIWGDWEVFRSANVEGTEKVAQACLKYDIERLVFISSPSIYSSKEDRLNIPETFVAPKPLNYYIKSKIEAEKVVAKYHERGLYTVVLRPRGLFGIGDTSIIPRLLEANQKIGIPLINEGENFVDVTCVENVAYAAYLALVAEQVNGETFNITNGEPMLFKEILDQLLEKVGVEGHFRRISFKTADRLAGLLEFFYKALPLKGEPALTHYTVATLGTSQTLDISKAKAKLAYQPRLSIEKGIEKYADWWRENHSN